MPNLLYLDDGDCFVTEEVAPLNTLCNLDLPSRSEELIPIQAIKVWDILADRGLPTTMGLKDREYEIILRRHQLDLGSVFLLTQPEVIQIAQGRQRAKISKLLARALGIVPDVQPWMIEVGFVEKFRKYSFPNEAPLKATVCAGESFRPNYEGRSTLLASHLRYLNPSVPPGDRMLAYIAQRMFAALRRKMH